jgi:hypothetical protein
MDRTVSGAMPDFVNPDVIIPDFINPDLASAGPDFVLLAWPGARTERLIIDNQN